MVIVAVLLAAASGALFRTTGALVRCQQLSAHYSAALSAPYPVYPVGTTSSSSDRSFDRQVAERRGLIDETRERYYAECV